MRASALESFLRFCNNGICTKDFDIRTLSYETGAIVKLTSSLVKIFGEKRVLWAIGGSCCILGIPVFPDTISLLTIPLCVNLAQQTGISMMAFASVIQISITTSSLVPPTPGPVAGAAVLGLPLGIAIPWGILVSIPGLLVTVLYSCTLKDKQVPLNPAFLKESAENAAGTASASAAQPS